MRFAAEERESRKWRRRAALLCLLFLILTGLLVGMALRQRERTSEELIRAAREAVRSDTQVRRLFGNPVEVGERPRTTEDDNELTFEVTGPSGKGEAEVQVRRTEDGRHPKVAGVRVTEPRDLRPKPVAQSPDEPTDAEPPGSASSTRTGTVDFGETFDFETIQFSSGRYSKIIQAVEKVVGPGRVRASTRFPPGGPAWTCVVVEGPERVCLLDPAWTLDDFPVLQEAGFQPVRGPATKTLSIYGSVTATTMGYQAAKGDRVIVLVCPKPDWEALKVPWPKP